MDEHGAISYKMLFLSKLSDFISIISLGVIYIYSMKELEVSGIFGMRLNFAAYPFILTENGRDKTSLQVQVVRGTY